MGVVSKTYSVHLPLAVSTSFYFAIQTKTISDSDYERDVTTLPSLSPRMATPSLDPRLLLEREPWVEARPVKGVAWRGQGVAVLYIVDMHSCQLSRFWRDSPEILTSVPPSPDLSRFFLERCTSYCAMLDYVRNSIMSVVTTLNLVRSCFPTARVNEASTHRVKAMLTVVLCAHFS